MRRAIVTGASRGIGLATTRMLLAEGWAVLGISRTEPPIERGEHQQYAWLSHDVGETITPDLIHDGVSELAALVHCAGIRGPYGAFSENDPADWERTITTNLIGAARMVRAALPALRCSEDGRILLFSGGGAFSPEPSYSAYATSKGATVALMETLAEELRETSVTVNAVAPGFVATDIHRGTPLEGKSDGGRAIHTAVACIRHLLSPSCRGLTGRTISAQHDDWSSLSPWTIPLMGYQGVRDRHKIERLQQLLVRRQRAM